MDKPIKLRKCPFCGSAVHLRKFNVLSSSTYQVICPSCEARTLFVSTGLCWDGHYISEKEAIQKVIEYWNNPRSLHGDCG